MTKYHINPDTQRALICRASTPDRCPVSPAFGEDAPAHFDSKTDLKSYVEKKNKEGNSSFKEKTKNRKIQKLIDERYDEFVDNSLKKTVDSAYDEFKTDYPGETYYDKIDYVKGIADIAEGYSYKYNRNEAPQYLKNDYGNRDFKGNIANVNIYKNGEDGHYYARYLIRGENADKPLKLENVNKTIENGNTIYEYKVPNKVEYTLAYSDYSSDVNMKESISNLKNPHLPEWTALPRARSFNMTESDKKFVNKYQEYNETLKNLNTERQQNGYFEASRNWQKFTIRKDFEDIKNIGDIPENERSEEQKKLYSEYSEVHGAFVREVEALNKRNKESADVMSAQRAFFKDNANVYKGLLERKLASYYPDGKYADNVAKTYVAKYGRWAAMDGSLIEWVMK